MDQYDEGRLRGHAVIGDQMVEVALAQLTDVPEELSLRLHHLEELDTQVNHFRQLLRDGRDSEHVWTDKTACSAANSMR